MISIIGRINKLFKSQAPEPYRRWSAQELADKKKYLEGKNSKVFTSEDYYLAAEWIIQRYLPEGDEPTPERWLEMKKHIHAKINKNLDALTNIRLEIQPVKEDISYHISKAEFKDKIIPVIKNFNFVPDSSRVDTDGNLLLDSLYLLSQDYSFEQNEAKSKLIYYCDTYSVSKLIHEVVAVYKSLKLAARQGSLNVKVTFYKNHCLACQAYDGKFISIASLLEAFSTGHPRFPHPTLYTDEINWCHAPLLMPDIPLKDGDDSSFHEWLVNNLQK